MKAAPNENSTWLVSITGITLVGAVLRFPGLFTELWLDEIWSISKADSISYPWEVFTAIHHDGNHYLNTMWLFFVGPFAPSWLLRIPAFAAGTLSIGAVGGFTLRYGQTCSTVAAALVAMCFPLVFYSSEARGYGLLMFFCITSIWAYMLYAERGLPIYRFLFWGLAVGGLLSQLLYLHVLFGCLAYGFYLRLQGNRRVPKDVVLLLIVPLSFLGFLWAVDLRLLQMGGGPPSSAFSVAIDAINSATGALALDAWRLGMAVVSAFAVGIGIWLIHRRGHEEWICIVTTSVLSPLFFLIPSLTSEQPSFFFPRYLLIGVLLVQLPLAMTISYFLTKSAMAKVFGGTLLLLIIAGHFSLIARFWQSGRGDYQSALRRICANENATPTIGSNFEFQTRMIIDFNVKRSGATPVPVFVERSNWPTDGVDWWIHNSFENPSEPPIRFVDSLGNTYKLIDVYPKFGFSGFCWLLYERTPS